MSEAVSPLMPSPGSAATIAISVHGPVGVPDMVVPIGATPVDVGRAYADRAGMTAIPLLQTALGEHLRADRALAEMGVESGAVLIAATGVRRAGASEDDGTAARAVAETPQVAAVVMGLAAAAAGLSALVRRSVRQRLAAHRHRGGPDGVRAHRRPAPGAARRAAHRGRAGLRRGRCLRRLLRARRPPHGRRGRRWRPRPRH
ncbi:hypothetical protein [Nocardioides sp. B-3]|uniref:hypothetical protein n=1 Tax=Nocardioides sp. B-3 TaxID=2895565 RepID=UPI0021538AB2|nr:hypothetical protein [Nocardioides sp. B-3]UUZ60914.1 hypothetical protein LP418_09460 [Nocardioides sp. B-3]